MQWFKHKTNSRYDDKIKNILQWFGLEGVTRYFWILEIIAEQMDDSDKCSVTLDERIWKAELHFYRLKDMRIYLQSIVDLGAIQLQSITNPSSISGQSITILCPKLLEIRARKNPIVNKSRTLDRDIDTDIDKESNTPISPLPLKPEEEKLWKSYLESWGRNGSYKLTPSRKKMLKTALASYGVEECLAAVRRFRLDEFEDRKKFNDIKYLFGNQERIDKWCGAPVKALSIAEEMNLKRRLNDDSRRIYLTGGTDAQGIADDQAGKPRRGVA